MISGKRKKQFDWTNYNLLKSYISGKSKIESFTYLQAKDDNDDYSILFGSSDSDVIMSHTAMDSELMSALFTE